jgi:hypothetical protein
VYYEAARVSLHYVHLPTYLHAPVTSWQLISDSQSSLHYNFESQIFIMENRDSIFNRLSHITRSGGGGAEV